MAFWRRDKTEIDWGEQVKAAEVQAVGGAAAPLAKGSGASKSVSQWSQVRPAPLILFVVVMALFGWTQVTGTLDGPKRDNLDYIVEGVTPKPELLKKYEAFYNKYCSKAVCDKTESVGEQVNHIVYLENAGLTNEAERALMMLLHSAKATEAEAIRHWRIACTDPDKCPDPVNPAVDFAGGRLTTYR